MKSYIEFLKMKHHMVIEEWEIALWSRIKEDNISFPFGLAVDKEYYDKYKEELTLILNKKDWFVYDVREDKGVTLLYVSPNWRV